MLAQGFIKAAVAVAGTSAMIACGTSTTASSTTGTAPPSVCAGVGHCKIVARADVDGDGVRDQIGWVQKSKKRVVIRVVTADRQHLRHSVDVAFWPFGGAWGGAAAIDGRRGHELLVGSSMGAHTPGYTELTYRKGRLVVRNSPRGEDHWYIDGAYSVAVGWWRHVSDGRLTMTYKWAYRTRTNSFKGADVTYLWRHGGWVKTGSVKRHYRNLHAANPIAGWHVPGLKEWPGV